VVDIKSGAVCWRMNFGKHGYGLQALHFVLCTYVTLIAILMYFVYIFSYCYCIHFYKFMYVKSVSRKCGQRRKTWLFLDVKNFLKLKWRNKFYMKIHYNKWWYGGFSCYYDHHSIWQKKHCDIETHVTFSW
jgi:hypothetical protein